MNELSLCMNEFPDQHDPTEDFVRRFAQERRRLYGFIFALIPNADDAEDIFQQTSLVLWQKFKDFDRTRDFFAWASGIALNKVRNHRRGMGRSRVRFSDDLLQALADHKQVGRQRTQHRHEFLQECLHDLNAQDRQLIVQMYSEVKTAQELADEMGRAVQTIYNRLHKIRGQLLRCVDHKWSKFAGV